MGEILNYFTKNLSNQDRIRIYVEHPDLEYPISLPFIKVEDLTAEMIVNQISNVLQSNKKLVLDDKIIFQTSIIKFKSGSGGSRLDEFIIKKQSIVKVRNEDDKLCALRAILIGKAYADRDKKGLYTYEQMRDAKNNLQSRLAYQLARSVNLNTELPIGIKEIKRVEHYLKDYQLFVIDADCMHGFIYVGKTREKKIFLYLKNQHYYMVKSLAAFYSVKNFCFRCYTPYSSKFSKHKCNDVCKRCQDKYCKIGADVKKIKCEFCEVICRDETCYTSHLQKVCGKIKKCSLCGKFEIYGHVCHGKWCRFCKKQVDHEHKCYILTESEKNVKTNPVHGYVFFDYESMQNTGEHIPNLILAQKACINCMEKKQCEQNCKMYEFRDNDKFCAWLFQLKHYIAIAHNMKGKN
jgi:hypothetical protein